VHAGGVADCPPRALALAFLLVLGALQDAVRSKKKNLIPSATAVPGGQEGVQSLADYYAARDANKQPYRSGGKQTRVTSAGRVSWDSERAGTWSVRLVGDGEQALDAVL